MSVTIELQINSTAKNIPTKKQFQTWAHAVLKSYRKKAEVVIRVVDEAESATLNSQYRHKQGPTNVLSFSFEVPEGIQTELLGDLIICAPLVATEAIAQNKTLIAHWAHLVVHGVLHLLGYDHIKPDEAAIMESIEQQIMQDMGFPNPYEIKD